MWGSRYVPQTKRFFLHIFNLSVGNACQNALFSANNATKAETAVVRRLNITLSVLDLGARLIMPVINQQIIEETFNVGKDITQECQTQLNRGPKRKAHVSSRIQQNKHLLNAKNKMV